MLASCGPAVAGNSGAEDAREVQEQQLGSEQQPQPACKATVVALPHTVVDGWAVVVKGLHTPAAEKIAMTGGALRRESTVQSVS